MTALHAIQARSFTRRLSPLIFIILAAALSACISVPPTAPSPDEALARVPVSKSSAVIALADSARADAAVERFPDAASKLERALRIEPRNPRLWYELARVRAAAGEHRQAENLAARSNAWAGGDKLLRAANWQLIGEARRAEGDDKGANEAFAKAAALAD